METNPDCLIVGAGMAGISAALWCHRLGLRFAWVEAAGRPGGQLWRIHGGIPDYPGLAAPNGASFLASLQQQLQALELAPALSTAVVAHDSLTRTVKLSDGRFCQPRTILIATGAEPRRLVIPGEETWRGRGVSDSATRDRAFLAGQVVAVVGGGDAALENALILSEVCPKVYLLHRGASFRAQPGFQQAVSQHPRIEVRFQTRVVAVQGNDSVQALEIETADRAETLAVGAMVVKVGVAAALGPWAGCLRCNADGRLWVDLAQRTSEEGIWAAGDVCNAEASSLVASAGQAMVAVKQIALTLADA
ncbi:MAG: NAD(P)/FAD-dependent oxidoreductase [Candidatus Sericytochromatia bacterium]|nr:NAD(P)/FAD-dependent oxidoreductase [Candidatus Sericytochromatia bacterium]